MKDTVTVNKKELFKRIEKLSNQLENKKTREFIYKELFCEKGERNTSRNKDYQIIYKILYKEYGNSPISQTSIWRLLQIKEKSSILYNEIINENLSIKKAYNLLINKRENKNNSIQSVSEYSNFEQIKNELKNITTYIEEQYKSSKIYSNKQLQEIDEEIFRMRKTLGRLIAKNFTNDET